MSLRKTKRPLYERIGLSKREYYNDDILKPHERDFVRKFSRLGEEIEWIKRDSVNPKTLGYNPTNDFVWRGKEWELKSILGNNIVVKTAVKRINRSVDSGKRNICIDLGKRAISKKLQKALSKYNSSRFGKRYVERIIVCDSNGIQEVRLE